MGKPFDRDSNCEILATVLTGEVPWCQHTHRADDIATAIRLADEFGIWKEKSMYGVKYLGVERTTVIIGRDGRVARIFPEVKIPGHVEEVESSVRALG